MYDSQLLLTSRVSAIVIAAISVAGLLCSEQVAAQVKVGHVVIAPDITQPVPGDCANYNSVLSTTGVSANGQTYPDRCRATVMTPLFDGVPLGSNMLAFLNAHPGLFTTRVTPGRAGCETASRFNVTLSASLQSTRLEWTGAPVVGAKCTNEVVRVNAASTSISAAYIRTVMNKLLEEAERDLMSAQPPSACGSNVRTRSRALEQQEWNLLQRIANDEIHRFEVSVAPRLDTSSGCAAKCNLCFPGWVGTIQCTATANDPSYQWHEVQTWDVGGVSLTAPGGNTIFPANFTARGNGSKTNGPSWTINATTTTGTFTDAGVNANKRFSTSNSTVAGGITWSTGMSGAVGQMQVKFNADQVGGNTATVDPTATLPSCINTQQKPANVACSVSCNWDLLQQ